MVATLSRINRAKPSHNQGLQIVEESGCYVFPSDLGYMAITWQGDVLTSLTFGHPSSAAAAASIPQQWDFEPVTPPATIQRTVERLQRFAAGESDSFQDVSIDLNRLTDFQLRIVKACRKIRAGELKSYAELAAAAGYPGAARAVGNVMRSNRFPLIVPCHRVIGSDGKLCGFSSPEGLKMKERLLVREGAWKPATDRQTVPRSFPALDRK